MPTYVWDGDSANEATGVHVMGENGLTHEATAMVAIPAGYHSVANMISSPFGIAHRGGGYTNPEMTMRAYTQSVARGYGALELSLARTTDGVWFGLHDQNLDRTSQTTVGQNADEMTWAEVQQYAVSLPPPGASADPQPYMLAQDLLDVYGSSHVIFVDLKYAGAYQGELLDLLLATVPAQRLVGKGFVTGASWAGACAARSVATWGYLYTADVPLLVANAQHWDMLGLEFSATQGTWDTVLGYGKPVIGHIAVAQSDADDAITKGASGVMVSNTRDIVV